MIDPLFQTRWLAVAQGWQRDALARAALRVVVPSTEEPVSVADAGAHLRLDAYGSPPEYPDEALLTALISAAREYVEGLSGLVLAPKTLEMTGRSFDGLCRWPGDLGILLKVAPVTGIESVRYIDGDGNEQTMASSDWLLDSYATVPALFPAYGVSTWPTPRDEPNAVRIRFTAGYAGTSGSPTVEVIPQSLRAAILLMLGHLYENREQTTGIKLDEIPLGIQALIEPYRLRLPFA